MRVHVIAGGHKNPLQTLVLPVFNHRVTPPQAPSPNLRDFAGQTQLIGPLRFLAKDCPQLGQFFKEGQI